ncbi:nod factor export atp-binding protein i [Moniliophthora roreri]|uniref:ABC transporter domain-containing protein n=1 Tax=Moniliophthora roreri TaxID=221103 RepID=A0A0W0G8U7_MONRR|nr:nod factor export atp-binding protein i [Moniliophthora roreri]
MSSLFWRQLKVLLWKNWIILSKHPFLNILRCFILPVAYGIFLAVAQIFLIKKNNNGLGTPAPIYNLHEEFDGSLALLWADNTDGTSSPNPSDIMARITRDFTDSQKSAIRQAPNASEIPASCPQNFNLFSECYAAIVFNDIPAVGTFVKPINYTIRADGGLYRIDVINHNSDFERRILPLQWAIDQAIIEAQTGIQVPTPLEWPFTQQTNEEQDTDIRLSYIRGLRTLLVLALFICYVGIAYQLPGAVTAERANLITSHMKAMGLLDSAKILSWHISLSLAYIPAWTIVSLVWHYQIFTETSAGLVFIFHLILGLLLASYSFFVAAPFGKSPQLAAVVSTLLSIVFAILALVFERAGTGAAFIFSIIFPPGWYIFVIRAMCGWENHLQASNLLKGDPDNNLTLLPLLIAGVIDIFLWPWLGCLLENRLYDARNPSDASKRGRRWWPFSKAKRPTADEANTLPPDIAISIRNLEKTFNTSLFRPKKGLITAVSDLSLDIPNAGKSTTLSILAGLTARTKGSVQFENEDASPTDTPLRGSMGIVPQKNVLFPDLTCYQTLRVWSAVKWSKNSNEKEDLEQLLRDCDLGAKIHHNADTLSGGQKRKLQLAIGLVGGSKVVLVDECTSGVDPLSRRALWRTLTSFRQERTIVFTTHFLDEADLLADHIAILAAPGKLVAQGTPVALKRDLGEGYTIQVTFDAPVFAEKDPFSSDTSSSGALLRQIQAHAPRTHISVTSTHQASYHLKAKDPVVVEKVLQMLEENKRKFALTSYDVLGTTIEDIFLDLMRKNELATDGEKRPSTGDSESLSVGSVQAPPEKFSSPLALASGKATSPLLQAFTIFYKRWLISKRSWLTPVLAVLVAIAGSCIPLVFVRRLPPTCVRTFRNSTTLPLFLPVSGLNSAFSSNRLSHPLVSPPGVLSMLGNTTQFFRYTNVTDNATFVDEVTRNYRNLTLGGISVDLNSGQSLVAWEGTSPGYKGPPILNLASNILYNNALNTSGNSDRVPTIIRATYSSFPPVAAGTLSSLRWVAFFGAAMSVYPAFFAIYVSKERKSAVQAMQFSNGLTNTVGLWLGHLMFDFIFSVISATIIIIIFASVSNQFHGPGFFWFIMVLYGIAGTLFAYCMSLVVSSPLAAFAAVAGYQIIIFVLYLAGYLLTLTYAKTSEAGGIITTIHFTISILSPVASVVRAALVSTNLFSLLCIGDDLDPSAMGDMLRFGGPILYLIVYSLFLLAVLVWYDSGSRRPRLFKKNTTSKQEGLTEKRDVLQEADAVSSSDDLLRILNVSKSFDGNRVVDDISLGVSRDAICALLGPNGAGKTTTLSMCRGDIVPDSGDIFIAGTSVVRHPKSARSGLGVCPQFTAIDSQLTVREHLIIYGRLKGLGAGEELRSNIEIILKATALSTYADRLAAKLSGGNQRKLSLAIALIGNPSVVLIDEFSTGIDAKMKREMWTTLRNVAIGKAVVITTHSMEEASALATKVGILAKRMLAVGTTASLSDRYATYEVHFACRTRDEVSKAQVLMSKVPGARLADDVATRFEVPIRSESNGNALSLAQLFHVLSSSEDFTEHTVEKASLESVFMKVIRENKVSEEDSRSRRSWRWW